MKILITLLFIMGSSFSQTHIEIKDLQWKNRVLLVFPADKNAKGLGLTDAIQVDLVDRDLIYFILEMNLRVIPRIPLQKIIKKNCKSCTGQAPTRVITY